MARDENGDYVFKKGTFALIVCLITLLGSIITVVAYGVTIKSDVDYLKQSFEDQDLINQKINKHDTAIILNQERIISMHDDISEIKSDVKELLLR